MDKEYYHFLKEIQSQPQQDAFILIDKTVTNHFWIEVGHAQKNKYIDYNRITFPQLDFKPHMTHCYYASFSEYGKLRLSKLGEIAINMHRTIDGPIKQLIIKRQGNRWYAIFCVERQVLPMDIDKNRAVGIDVGLNKYAVLSNETS